MQWQVPMEGGRGPRPLLWAFIISETQKLLARYARCQMLAIMIKIFAFIVGRSKKSIAFTDLSGLPYKQYQACAYEIRHHLVKRVLETRFSLLYLFKIQKRLALASFAASNAGW